MQEERWRLAIEATGLGTWEVDGATGEHRWSPEFLTICGLADDAAPATGLFASLIHPDDRAWVNEAYAAAYQPGGDGGYEAEFRIHRADTGEERWVLARGRVRLDAAGTLVSATGILLDTTARRHAERALSESEERYRLAVASFQGAVYETDLRTGHAYRAPQAYAMLGVDEAEAEPTREWWHRRIHPEDVGRLLDAVEAALAGRLDRIDCQYRMRHASGDWVWIWHRGVVARDVGGRAVKLTGAFLDITAQKRAEEALAARTRELTTVLDAVPAAVWFSYDPDMRDVAQNRYAARLTRSPDPGQLGFDDTPARVVMQQDGQRLERSRLPLERAFQGDDVDGEELVFVPPGGDERTLLVNARGLRDEDGDIIGAVAIALDITERKRADEQRRLLVNELNHRVKNTLATVQSLTAQTLRSHEADRHAAKALTDRILALSRAHDLLTRESWEGATLASLVRQVVELHAAGEAHRFVVTGRDLRVEPRVALSLAMALHELATNAVKYGALSNGTGAVEIGWTLSPDREAGQTVLQLRWRERGGPPVVAPTRRGFGTRLLERSMAAEPDGGVEMMFAPEGFEFAEGVREGTRIKAGQALMRLPQEAERAIAAE